jgi:lysophospholipase L1-like esterase
MIRPIQFAFFVIMLSAPSMAQEINLSREVKMLALGDSYTIGQSVELNERWPHQLIDRIRSLGFEGDYPDYIATTGWTTRNLIQGITSTLDTEKSYNLVSILIGVNNQYQGTPIELFEPDLRTIIDLALGLVDQDNSRVLMLSIPDYAYTPFGGGNEGISREIDDYNGIKRKVAAEYRIAFVDITPISREGLLNPSLVAADGLHPSEVQYAKWVEAIIPRLRFETTLFNIGPAQLPDDPVSVYPNPAGSSVQIDSQEKISRISIFNAKGSNVSDQMINSLPVEIDLSHLGPGLYILWFYHVDDDTVSRRTLIVHADVGLGLLE